MEEGFIRVQRLGLGWMWCLFLLLEVNAVMSAWRCARDRRGGRRRVEEANADSSTLSHDQQGRYWRRRE